MHLPSAPRGPCLGVRGVALNATRDDTTEPLTEGDGGTTTAAPEPLALVPLLVLTLPREALDRRDRPDTEDDVVERVPGIITTY